MMARQKSSSSCGGTICACSDQVLRRAAPSAFPLYRKGLSDCSWITGVTLDEFFLHVVHHGPQGVVVEHVTHHEIRERT